MFDLTVQQGFAYTQQICMYVCWQVWITKICNCTSLRFVQTVSNKPLCLYSDFCEYEVTLTTSPFRQQYYPSAKRNARWSAPSQSSDTIKMNWKSTLTTCSHSKAWGISTLLETSPTTSIPISLYMKMWLWLISSTIHRNILKSTKNRKWTGKTCSPSWVDTCTYLLAWACLVLSKLSNYLGSWQLIIFGIH